MHTRMTALTVFGRILDPAMDNESTNCNSHFLMNGHNNDRSLPFEILGEIFSHLASNTAHCNFDMCSSSLDPGIMPQ